MNSNRGPAAAPAVAALLLLTALTGCAATVPGSDATSTLEAPTTPSATATPPVAADPSDPTTWLVDPSGIGPIRVGAELGATMSGLTEYTAGDPALCRPDIRVYSAPTLPTLWIGVTTGSPTTIVSVSVGGDLPDSPRLASSPKTAEGIALGSTEADVVAAYPQAPSTGEDPSMFYEVPQASGAHVEIQTFDGTVQVMSVVSTPYPMYEFCG